MTGLDKDKVRKDFDKAVNMAPAELGKWLKTEESREVGFKKNGNQYTFFIKKFQPNPPTNAGTFAFDKAKYKGVKVVDLR